MGKAVAGVEPASEDARVARWLCNGLKSYDWCWTWVRFLSGESNFSNNQSFYSHRAVPRCQRSWIIAVHPSMEMPCYDEAIK